MICLRARHFVRYFQQSVCHDKEKLQQYLIIFNVNTTKACLHQKRILNIKIYVT